MLTEDIQKIVLQHARLDPGVAVGVDSDLYALGMTSLATVNLMLALEDRYDIEFSDALLQRETFASVAALVRAVEALKQA
ncbi:aminoacyl carrier protein [mine drainage metagenome]|uniref:Aminoacyl carrier protein n=1 Tax=mine drainage metagenome TaxID=410659 RepID=A0A1J5R1W7_9ZZZZ